MTDKIENGEFKEETTPKKTAMQELKDKIAVFQKLSLAWTIISLLFSTAFLVYSVFTKFGNPIYRYVSLGALGIYVLIFLSLFIFAVEGKKKKRMLLKTYKTGISVFKAILNVIHTVLTISVVLSSVSGSEINKVVSLLVAILTILFAALTIVFKLVTLILTNVIPKLAKLGAQIAKEAIDEKIKESKTLTNIVTYAKNRSVKKKAKAERKKQKEEAAAEKKRLKEERKADKLAKSGESATSSQTVAENAVLTDVNQSSTGRNTALPGDGKREKRVVFFRKDLAKTTDKVACDVTNFNETDETVCDNKAKKKVLRLFKVKKPDSSKD
ncbi:MAG: hypothetical protein ACI4QU_04895 [Christensenellales bacterium]